MKSTIKSRREAVVKLSQMFDRWNSMPEQLDFLDEKMI